MSWHASPISQCLAEGHLLFAAPEAVLQVTENPKTRLGFQVKHLCQDTSCAELQETSPCLYHHLLSFLFRLRDFYCNMSHFMFRLSMKNWTLWITETLYGAQWFENQRTFSLCWAEGGAKHDRWRPGRDQLCCVCIATKLILLECWDLHPCAAV